MQKRTTYHTYVKLLYLHGKLESQTKKQIPKSTRHNWKDYDYSKIFGLDHQDDFDEKLKVSLEVTTRKRLYQLNKTILKISGLWIAFLASVKNKKELLKKCSKEIVETVDSLRENQKLSNILFRFDISKQQYDYWKRTYRKCGSSVRSLCRIQHPHQFTKKEVKTIKNYMENSAFQHWPARSVYYKILNDGMAYFSLSSFYNYTRWLGFTRKTKKHKKKYERLNAFNPFEKLHMDVTIFRFPDHTKAYVYLIIDNFSRAVLNWKVSSEIKARISLENIYEVFDRYGLHNRDDIELIVDGGSENKKEVDEFIALPKTNLKKSVAQLDIVESNSMVEAANRILKYQYLFPNTIKNITQLCENMEFYQQDFNDRPHGDLYGLSPLQILSGEKIPDKNRFKNHLITARKNRIEANQQFNCGKCLTSPEE